MKDSLLIVDGLNYLFRAYFGITDAIKTKSGVSINAVYGFLAFLRKVVELVKPKYILVIFDSENATANKQQHFIDYKASRKYEDTRMFGQLRIIKSILDLMRIKYLEENNIEADDLIGAYCKFGRQNNCSIFISSNDFDFMQLVSDNVYVVRNYRGEQQIFDEDKVERHFGISPDAYPDYLALLGDKSDNIKGVEGVGKKTAQMLINNYSSIEFLLSNLNVLPEKLKNRISNNADRVSANKKIITINTSVTSNFVSLDDILFDDDALKLKTTYYINKLNI